MIISIFAIDIHNNRKLYRSSAPVSSSKMNYFLTEFANLAHETDGLIEKDTYRYIYISNNMQRIGMQTTKDHSVRQANETLRFIEQNSTEDIFDLLFTIDNVLFGGVAVKLDLQPIKEMDSQEEKIHKIMMENKKLEIVQREKEYKQTAVMQQITPQIKAPEIKTKKIEKSSQPVLIVIREKVKLEMNKEGHVTSNTLNGEMDMVITDAKYRQLQIKMKNLKPSLKYSPYLDKNALKKQVLRFEKERGLNKSIPLLKWTGVCTTVPISLSFWSDEDDEKFVNIVEFKALKNIKEIEFRLNSESATEIEIEGDDAQEEDGFIVWRCRNVKKDESKNISVKCCAFKGDCLFPISVKLISETLETSIDVESMSVEESPVEEFELRKIFECEDFTIVNEY